jgi:hypothetical protein
MAVRTTGSSHSETSADRLRQPSPALGLWPRSISLLGSWPSAVIAFGLLASAAWCAGLMYGAYLFAWWALS